MQGSLFFELQSMGCHPYHGHPNRPVKTSVRCGMVGKLAMIILFSTVALLAKASRCGVRTGSGRGPSGAIGSSMGLALAARLWHPERHVFVFQGDGTFGYHAMDFDTALRYDLPIISLLGHDTLWNAEHQLQIRNYGADFLGQQPL